MFKRLNHLEERLKRSRAEAENIVWDENTLKAFDAEFRTIKANLQDVVDNISDEDASKRYVTSKVNVTAKLLEQMDQIEKYRANPNTRCIKFSTRAVNVSRSTSSYRTTFLRFMTLVNPNLNIEHLLLDHEHNIIDKLDQMDGSYESKEGMLTAIKYYIGCAFCLHEKWITRQFISSIYCDIEQNFKVVRKENEKQKQHRRMNRNPYEEFVEKFGLFVTMQRLRNEVHRIRDIEPNVTLKIIMTLYVDYVPRRTLDYAKMLVIKKIPQGYPNSLDTEYNYIVLDADTPLKEQGLVFIFNHWKLSRVKGTQTLRIARSFAARLLDYLNHDHYKDCETVSMNGNEYPFLLYTGFNSSTKTPVTSATQIGSQVQQIINRWDIPFNIRNIRHLYTTWAIDTNHIKDFQELQILAECMGSSDKMLKTVYYDTKFLKNMTHVLFMPLGDKDFEEEEKEVFSEVLKKIFDQDREGEIIKRKTQDEILVDDDDSLLDAFKDRNGNLLSYQRYVPPSLPNPFPTPTKYCGGLDEPYIKGSGRGIQSLCSKK